MPNTPAMPHMTPSLAALAESFIVREMRFVSGPAPLASLAGTQYQVDAQQLALGRAGTR
jgi:hypothetical protein